MKIIALCCYRNGTDMANFVGHLEPHVEGLIFLDDRSEPIRKEQCRNHIAAIAGPKCLGIIERRSGTTLAQFAYEARNREILINEALAEGATHILCLDVDERMELPFLRSLKSIIAAMEEMSYESVSVRIRELWKHERNFDMNGTKEWSYRVDGIWGKKRKPVLFKVYPRGEFCLPPYGRKLHDHWLLLHPETQQLSAANLYHLGSLTPELRAARVAKFKAIDDFPESNFRQGYDYLADETGLKLEQIPEGRGWIA